MAKAISQRIQLDGAEEIKRLLGQIGQEGKAAFGQLEAAVATATRNLERVSSAVAAVERSFSAAGAAGRNFGTAFGELGNSFGRFETAISRTSRNVTLLVAAIAGATEGLRRFVVGGIKAGDDIEEQAQALGLTAQRYQELGFAASESGVKQGTFASAMRRLSQEIEQASQDSSKALVRFLDSTSKNFDDWGGRIKVVGNNTASTFAVVAEGARKLQAALAEQGIQRSVFQLQQELAKLATGTAAQRAEFEKLTGLTLPSAANGLDALRKQAEGAKDAIRTLGLDLKKGADGTVDLGNVLEQLADKFSAMQDGPQKLALAMDIFGRSAGPQLLPFLNQGRAGIEALLTEARKLGLFLSKDQIEASSKAARAFDILSRSLSNARAQIGAALAPLAQGIASGLTDVFSQNQAALKRFADELNARALPYVRAFFDLLSGRENSTPEAQRLQAIADRVGSISLAIQGAFTGVIVPAFQGLMAILDTVAAGINAVFGANLTGAELGIVLLVTKLVGGFALLAASLTLITGLLNTFRAGLLLMATAGGLLVNVLRLAGGLLLALVGWPALIVAGVAAAVVGLVLYRKEIADFFSNLRSNAQDDFKKLAEFVRGPFRQEAQADLQAFLTWAKEAFASFRNDAQDDFKKLADYIKGEFRQNAQADLQAFIDFVKNAYKSITEGRQAPPLGPEDRGIGSVGGQSDGPGLSTDIGGARRRGGDQFQTEQANAFTVALTAVQKALDAVAASMKAVVAETSTLGTAATATGEALRVAFEGAATGAATAWQGLGDLIQSTLQALESSIASVGSSIQGTIDGIISGIESAVARLQELAQAAREAAAAAGGGGSSDGGGFAAGGYTGAGGRLQPAGMVHKGEYVQPARVVSQPGVLAFMEVLRRTGDLQATIARFTRGFSSGGFVEGLRRQMSPLVPGYASGGLVGAMAGAAFPHLGQVDLNIGGTVVPVYVDRGGADLMREAVRRQTFRTGVTPR